MDSMARKLIAWSAGVIAVGMLAVGAPWFRASTSPERGALGTPAGTGAPSRAAPPAATREATGREQLASPVAALESSYLDARTSELVQQAEAAASSAFHAIPGQRLPVDNVAVAFGALAAKARSGDLAAARSLFDALEACRRGPHTPEGLDAALMRASDATPERLEASRAMIRRRYAHCGGLTEAQLATRSQWGEQLAEAGDAMAQLQYQHFVPLEAGEPDYQDRLRDARERAARYLDQQLRRGNAHALGALQSYYIANRLVGRDYYRSYVYGWAYVMSQQENLPPGHAAYLGLANAESHLTPAQVASARSEGTSLQRSCCGG